MSGGRSARRPTGVAGVVAFRSLGPCSGGVTYTSVRSPLPAAGGTDPEDIEAAKRAAPGSVAANQPRALVPSDYVRLAEQLPIVARAAADLRVTGSHRLITVAIQPINSADPPSWLQREAHRSLHRVRRMGC